MKYLFLLIIIVTCLGAYAQKLTGIVTDKTTRQPLSGALVSLGTAKAFTDTSGQFEVKVSPSSDTLKIVHFAYKTYMVRIGKSTGFLHIELQPAVISLQDVTVRGSSDFKKDSIENRLAFAKQFNYTGPTVKDAFTGNTDKQPGDLISINSLLLIAALTKKSSPEYKFKQKLLSDEHEQYVDERFNKGIVSRITGLKGDTLSAFLTLYRPTYEFVKKATEYDMDVYIKDCLKKFEKDGFKINDPLVKEN